MSLMDTAAAQRQALPRRPVGDYYATPTRCTEALLAADPPPWGDVWEPACGDGAIAKVLKAAGGYVPVATDLHDRGYGTKHVDFLEERRLWAPSIVTNPPFNLADEFALHALGLGAGYVALFQRLSWLEGAKRHARLWSKHPPSRVWVFSSRQTLWRGDDPDPKGTGGAIAFAWFVWRHGWAGGTQLGWLQTPDPRAVAAGLM
jgi:hypothetical protein